MSEFETVGGDSIKVLSLPSVKHVMSTDWRNYAACAKMPKAVFFDYKEQNLPKKDRKGYLQIAMNTCAGCPSRQECYEFAVCNNEPYGIWAGTTPEERKGMYKEYSTTGALPPLP